MEGCSEQLLGLGYTLWDADIKDDLMTLSCSSLVVWDGNLVSFLPAGSPSCDDPARLRPSSCGDGAEGLGGWDPEGRLRCLGANHLPRSGHRLGTGHR